VALAVLALSLWGGQGRVVVDAQGRDADVELSMDHVALSVPDIAASVAWYSEMLGFREVRRGGRAGGMQTALIQHGAIRIELFQLPDAASLPDARRNPSEDFRTHGVKHFGYEVKDVRALVDRLRAKGVNVAFEVVENPGAIFAFVSDNAGNAVELIQHKR
jgi:methylmalonyl-CoA/ethylmalonyl-CoA epimerase